MELKSEEKVKNTYSPMFNFIKSMWVMRKATEYFIEEQVKRDRITEKEKEQILSTMQINEV